MWTSIKSGVSLEFMSLNPQKACCSLLKSRELESHLATAPIPSPVTKQCPSPVLSGATPLMRPWGLEYSSSGVLLPLTPGILGAAPARHPLLSWALCTPESACTQHHCKGPWFSTFHLVTGINKKVDWRYQIGRICKWCHPHLVPGNAPEPHFQHRGVCILSKKCITV